MDAFELEYDFQQFLSIVGIINSEDGWQSHHVGSKHLKVLRVLGEIRASPLLPHLLSVKKIKKNLEIFSAVDISDI